MRLFLTVVCLWLCLVSVSIAAGEPPRPTTTAKADDATVGLWLTVKFYIYAPHSNKPYVEIGTLVTPGARIQQQFTTSQGSYSITGVLGSVSDGQYPLSIKLLGGVSASSEIEEKLRLGVPVTWGCICGMVKTFGIITLTHAPEWQPHLWTNRRLSPPP